MAEIISNINPKRIEWCCREFAVKIGELARQQKISEQKLQSGQLTYSQLRKVADYFGYSSLFFLGKEEPVAEKIHSVAFRTLAKQSVQFDRQLARIIKQAEWHRDLYISLTEELDEENIYAPPKITGTIADKAAAVQKWLGIDNAETYQFEDYRKIVESKEILVFQSTGYRGDWKLKDNNAIGFSIYHSQAPIIFIKKTSPRMQTFTLFHELGHLLLHKGTYIDDKRTLTSRQSEDSEQTANEFAEKCLPPGYLYQIDNIPKRVKQARSFNICSSLSKQSEIEAVQARYERYNRSRVKYPVRKSSDKKDSTRPVYRHRYMEPLRIFGRQYVGTVLTALHEQKITLNRASEYLDRLKINDLKKLDESIT